MTSVETMATTPAFSNDFEEYRRACRARFEQQKSSYAACEDSGSNQMDEETCVQQTGSPSLSPQVSSSAVECNTTINNLPPISSVPENRTPVEKVKAKSGRRNSLNKAFSAFSNMFKSSPPMSPKDKERAKQEKHKREQDARMAHLIAQLEFEGKSDAEIQMHLFHLRDLAQVSGPRKDSSLVGEWFRDMSQAFKDEFSLRRDRQCVTVHVSTVNPFAAAMPTNYVHDANYSYEDLLTLEPVCRGLASTDHLPTIVYEGQELPSNQTSCAVCMADFEASEELRSLACSHHFHKECIDKWLGVAPSCPVCKGEVSRE